MPWYDTKSLSRLCDAPGWLPLVAAVSSVLWKAFYTVLLPLPGIINWHPDIDRSLGQVHLYFGACKHAVPSVKDTVPCLHTNSHTNVSWDTPYSTLKYGLELLPYRKSPSTSPPAAPETR